MDEKYTRDLIKGKIAEVIFAEMFRVSGEFTVIPLGYEHTTPILAQYQHYLEVQQVLDNIRNAPDFALISEDRKRVFLVEVKYRKAFTSQELFEIDKDVSKRFNPCFIFLASNDNFYFSPCSWIIKNQGQIEALRESWINKELQMKQLNLLREFIK
jgi:hypothetical protein